VVRNEGACNKLCSLYVTNRSRFYAVGNSIPVSVLVLKRKVYNVFMSAVNGFVCFRRSLNDSNDCICRISVEKSVREALLRAQFVV
jgi:hypothetical protein